MILSKIINVIVLLAVMIHDHNCYPFLIVVPNSTWPNWRREIRKWVPSIRVVTYYGSSTARRLAYDHELYLGATKKHKELCCHGVVTSFETAANGSCAQFFKSIPWQGL